MHFVTLLGCKKQGEEVIASDPKDAPNGMIFRRDSVSVYNGAGKEIHLGVYPESAIVSSMEEALQLLNNAEAEPLVAMSIFHYMFDYIHPFYNGNVFKGQKGQVAILCC